MILRGNTIVGTVGRVTRTDRLGAVPKTRVTASNHRPMGSGDSRPARGRRAWQRPRARGRGKARRAPGADLPRSLPAEALALVVIHSLHLTLLFYGTSRL